MNLIQIIECIKCKLNISIPYQNDNPIMPWEQWSNGCPKCGNKIIDVYIITDKFSIIRMKNAHIKMIIRDIDDDEIKIILTPNSELEKWR